MVRAKTRTSLYPFAYVGVESNTPVQFTVEERSPTNDDYSEWNIGAIWLDITTQEIWMLVKKLGHVATWIMFATSIGDLHTITGKNGLAVAANAMKTIFLKSVFSPLTLVGDPGTNTVNLTTNGTIATGYVLDGPSAAQAVDSKLKIKPGTGISITGSGSTITVSSAPSVALTYQTNSVIPATADMNKIVILDDAPITNSGSGNTWTISGNGDYSIQFNADDMNTATPNAMGEVSFLGGLNLVTSAGAPDPINTLRVSLKPLGGPGVVVTDSSGVLSSSPGTNGQVLIGSDAGPPMWNNITSTDGSVSIVNGSHTIDLSVVDGVVNAGDNIEISSPGFTIDLSETIHWPNTNAAATSGMIYLYASGGVGGQQFLHNYGPSEIGDQNTFIGRGAGNINLDPEFASKNTGVGAGVMQHLTTGHSNTAVGSGGTLSRVTSGSCNTVFGEQALFYNTIGNRNTSFGFNSLKWLENGSNNTSFGYEIGGTPVISGSNSLFFGHNIIATSDGSDRLRIYAEQPLGTYTGGDNQIYIGRPTGYNACYIAGIHGVTTSGGIAVYANSSEKLGTSTSSKRYKDNILQLESSSILNDLSPVTFTYKEDETNEQQYGLIAEEVIKVMPEIVVLDKDLEPFTVQYEKLIPLLLHKIQDLKKRIERIEVSRGIIYQ